MLTKIHHLGIVVNRLETAYGFWRDVLGLKIHKEATVADQGVKAALLPCGETEIELLEPIDPAGGVAKFLAKRGEGLHHLCFEADKVADELTSAKNKGLPMLDEAPRAGLAGLIGFLHPRASCGILVELAQPPAPTHPPAGATLAFDHLALVVDDVDAATGTFARNFGLVSAKAGPDPAATRMRIGPSNLLFYDTARAPADLGGRRGLAGIGLKATAVQALAARARGAGFGPSGGSGERGYCTTAHGVPVAVCEAGPG